MVVDYYPQEEGAVFDSESYIIPCYPDGAIAEVCSVKFGTTVAGRISVITVANDTGTGVGIALRASSGAGVPSRIPIIFYGIVKVTTTAVESRTCLAGSFAMNNGTSKFLSEATLAYAALQVAAASGSNIMGLCVGGPLTTAGLAGDEVLLLVGKTA